jgi:hypothetical protein
MSSVRAKAENGRKNPRKQGFSKLFRRERERESSDAAVMLE